MGRILDALRTTPPQVLQSRYSTTQLRRLRQLAQEELDAEQRQGLAGGSVDSVAPQPLAAATPQATQPTQQRSILERSLGGLNAQQSPFPFEEGGGFNNVLRALGNVPFGMRQRFDESVDFLKDVGQGVAQGRVPESVQNLGRLVQGAQQLGQRPTAALDQPNARLALQAGQEVARSFTPERLTNDPTEALANVATVVQPGAGGVLGTAGKGNRLARAAKKGLDAVTDPLQVGVEAGAKGVKATARGLARGGELGLSFLTGIDDVVLREAVQAGLEGNREPFLRMLTEERVGTDLLADAQQGVTQIRDKASQRYRQQLDELKVSDKQIPVRDLKNELFGNVSRNGEGGTLLDDFGIETTIGEGNRLEFDFARATVDPEHEGKIRRVLDRVLGHGTRPDDLTVKGMDSLKRFLNNVFLPEQEAGALVARLSADVRRRIVEAVPEYEAITKEYAQAQELLTDIRQGLSIRTGGQTNKKTAIGALTRSLRENRDFERQLLGTLEEETGRPLRAEVAGAELSQSTPKGFFGREKAIGIAAALFAGAALEPSVLIGLPLLPLASPRNAGRFLSSVGAGARQIKKVTDPASDLLEAVRAQNLFTQGMTVGQAIERLTGDETQPPSPRSRSLTTGLGRIQPLRIGAF